MKIIAETDDHFDTSKRLQQVELVAGNVLEERFLAELVAFMRRSAGGEWSITFRDPTGKRMRFDCKSEDVQS